MLHVAIVGLLVGIPPLSVVGDKDASLRIHRAQLVLKPGAPEDHWTWRFQLSGRGEATFTFQGQPTAPAGTATHVDDLEHATAPRFVEHLPWDPCTFGVGRFGRHFPATRDFLWPYGPQNWTEAWPPVRRAQDPLRARTLPSPEAQGVRMRFVLSSRPRWTQAVSLTRASATRNIDFSSLGPFAPPGRQVEIDLFVQGLAPAPSDTVTRLPDVLSLPEVAFEAPTDLLNAAVLQRQTLEKGPVWVLLYAGPGPRASAWNRYASSVGRNGRPPLRLVSGPLPEGLQPAWLIHRPWRGPLACPEGPEYVAAVAKHQQNTHRIYAALTGRRLNVVVGLSRDRGYLLEPFGNPWQVAATVKRLPAAEVDRARW